MLNRTKNIFIYCLHKISALDIHGLQVYKKRQVPACFLLSLFQSPNSFLFKEESIRWGISVMRLWCGVPLLYLANDSVVEPLTEAQRPMVTCWVLVHTKFAKPIIPRFTVQIINMSLFEDMAIFKVVSY